VGSCGEGSREDSGAVGTASAVALLCTALSLVSPAGPAGVQRPHTSHSSAGSTEAGRPLHALLPQNSTGHKRTRLRSCGRERYCVPAKVLLAVLPPHRHPLPGGRCRTSESKVSGEQPEVSCWELTSTPSTVRAESVATEVAPSLLYSPCATASIRQWHTAAGYGTLSE